MYALAFLNGDPHGTLPASASDVYIWVIRDSSDVWCTTMKFQWIEAYRDSALNYWAGGGPKWDTGTLVDVVIGVRTSPTDVPLVLIRRVPIGSTS